MDSNERVREILAKIIKNNKLTHAEMAVRAGVSQATITNFLTSRKKLTLKSADAILGALGLEIGIRRKQHG